MMTFINYLTIVQFLLTRQSSSELDFALARSSFGVSYGSHLVHDFLFADGGIGRAAADEAVEQLLTGLCLPAELADEFTEQKAGGSALFLYLSVFGRRHTIGIAEEASQSDSAWNARKLADDGNGIVGGFQQAGDILQSIAGDEVAHGVSF